MIRTILIGLFALCALFGITTTSHAATTVSGTLSGNVVWTKANSPYIITNTLTIPAGSALSIDPGVVVKMNGFFFVYIFGTLNSNGISSDPVIITSTKDDSAGGDTNGDGNATTPASGDWLSLYFAGGNGSFGYTDIRYGGLSNGPSQPMGQIWNQGGAVTISHSRLSYSPNFNVLQTGGTTVVSDTTVSDANEGFRVLDGVFTSTRNIFLQNNKPLSMNGGTLELDGNDFGQAGLLPSVGASVNLLSHGNNTGRGIAVSGTLTGDRRWVKDGFPYVLTNTVTIPAGASLLIDPGVVVKMDGIFFFYIYGNLTAGDSVSTSTVTITSIKDDTVGGDTNNDGTTTTPAPGDWFALYFINGSTGTLTHADMRYGGRSNGPSFPLGQVWNQGGVITVTDSTFSYSANYHLQQTSGTTTAMRVNLSNAPYGAYSTGGHMSMSNSHLYNLSHGVFNKSTLPSDVIDSRNNWWGDASGPYNLSGNPLGLGTDVSSNVLYAPWLGSDPSIPVPTCTVNCNSNVMFLPGVMGSRLYDTTGEIVWLSENDTEADAFRMNSDGTSASLGITTYDALATADGQQLHTDIYKSFLAEMKNWERDYHITATTTPYDWRLDYDDVVSKGRKLSNGHISYLVPPVAGHDPYLLETLKQLASSSPTGKVTIIGHSQGGLVAKALMQKIGAEATARLVDKVILVASPQLGTPQAVATMLNGTDAAIPFSVSAEKIRQLAQYTPSAYNLLPSANYFTYVDEPVITISSSTLPAWSSVYGDRIHWDQGMYNFMSDTPGLRTKPGYNDLSNPEIVGTSFLESARNAHNVLDTWVPPSGVQLITIAGWGEETLSAVAYVGKKTCLETTSVVILGRRSYFCGKYGSEVTLKPQHVIDGDGTVVEPSAHWASGVPSTRYWLNLKRYNFLNPVETALGFLPLAHADILEVPELRNLLKNIVIGATESLQYVSMTAPSSSDSSLRLHFTLHSPLTLGFIDALGNYTGVTATGTVFGIPDVQYERYGEVQWLSVPKDIAGQLVMRGTGSGSFTLDIEEVGGNETLSSTSFEGIPSSTSTVATMDISPASSVTASSSLLVDEDGDGTVDIALEAVENAVVILPVPVLDTTPPVTTASTTGNLGTNGWYTSNVTVTLSATDTDLLAQAGSGVSSTTYSLNNGGTWLQYSAPITITTEGLSSLLYRSIDKAGNIEATSTITIKIDKTAPEAQISVSTSTQDLLVEGVDALGTTTVSKDIAGSYTIIDQAGHTTKLFFQKTFTGARLTYARLTGIQYDQASKVALPSSSFLYVWDSKVIVGPVSQTIAVDGIYLIQAAYDKKLNKTVVIVLKKGVPIQTKTFAGLKIVRLTTLNGVVGYGL